MNAPMNTSLYVIAGEYAAAMHKLTDSDLPDDVIADTLESLSGDLEVKATNVAMFVRNLETSAEQIKLAEKAMAERRKAIENKAENIRRYLKENMLRTGISKIECPHFALTIKKNPPKLVIDDAGKIPSDYYIYPDPPAPYPDNALVKEKLLAGEVIEGAHIEQGDRLEIK